MKIFILLAFVAMIIGTNANPLSVHMGESKSERNDLQATTDSKDKPVFTDHYDQRQNGTENFRVKVDGLVFIMAPAETLLLAGAALEPNFTALLNENNEKPVPKPDKEEANKPKPEAQKVISFKTDNQDSAHEAHRPSLHFRQMLKPLLSKLFNQQHLGRRQ